MNLGADFKQNDSLLKKMVAFPGNFNRALENYQVKADERLLELVRQHASGRPGPNVVTGRYISRFVIVDHRVRNPSQQTHRLEYGFIGTDSLGRKYAQPPFPHFRPALEEMRTEYRRGIVPLVRQAWNASR